MSFEVARLPEKRLCRQNSKMGQNAYENWKLKVVRNGRRKFRTSAQSHGLPKGPQSKIGAQSSKKCREYGLYWEASHKFGLVKNFFLLTNPNLLKTNFWPGAPPSLRNQHLEIANFGDFSKNKSEFWNCCRNFGQKFLSKFLATWWGPPNLEMSGNAILCNSMHYS